MPANIIEKAEEGNLLLQKAYLGRRNYEEMLAFKFQSFWANHPSAIEKPFLLALSGGVDSMVLGHLFLETKKPFAIAHCNFSLRGEESDGDAAFVKAFAEKQAIPYFTTTFDTKVYASEQKLSIQEAARNLRYDWLEEIRQAQHFSSIVTAHHLNDSIETVLYNLTKGSGIRGLHGIPPVHGSIIRPLLAASRAEIEAYAQSKAIAFREDSSNADTKYQRNLIRKEVVPVLKKINTSLEKSFGENIERFKEAEYLYDYALEQLAEQMVEHRDDQVFIDLSLLSTHPARNTLLYEWLRPYGFSARQGLQIFQGGATESGRMFYSQSHQLLVNRGKLIVAIISNQKPAHFLIESTSQMLSTTEGNLHFSILENPPSHFPTTPNVALMDMAQLQFPLRLRRWQTGDQFQPFGMNGHHQKLQDYFNNQKLSRLEKERIWVLESQGTICWVVGYRLDERFKVKTESQKIWKAVWD